MKTRKIILVLAALLIVVAACKKRIAKTQTAFTTNTVDEHNAKNAIDWPGTYFGVMACGSGRGINTLISLNEDGTYEKTTDYLESKDKPETTKGKFTWSKDKSIITIGGNSYLIGENQLFQLDADNKVITGELAENYILNKTELETEPDMNDGYTLQQYIGDDKKEYNIIFNTNPKVPTVLIQSGDLEKKLAQTQSWAKGAEYKGNEAKLTIQGDNATLILNDKKIVLTNKQ